MSDGAGYPRAGVAQPERTAALVSLVADLLGQLEGTAVTECEFSAAGSHVLIRRSPSFRAIPAAPVSQEEEIPASWRGITAPLTGIFYTAETPQSPPFVTMGGRVAAGQVVGLIESMKMFNPVESDRDGTVRALPAENGARVERGQILLYLEALGDEP